MESKNGVFMDNVNKNGDHIDNEELNNSESTVFVNHLRTTMLTVNFSDVQVERFSEFNKLIRVTAFVLKLKDNILRSLTKNSIQNSEMNSPILTFEEIENARKEFIKYEQQKLKQSQKYVLWKKSLGLYENEDGIICCGGRLGNSELLHNQKFPIFLNHESHFTKLYILLCHEKVIWELRQR